MNKHKKIFLFFIIIACILLYFCGLPSIIVQYGIDNNIPAFDNGAPFTEVVTVFFFFAHLIGGIFIFSLYMMFYGCHKK